MTETKKNAIIAEAEATLNEEVVEKETIFAKMDKSWRKFEAKHQKGIKWAKVAAVIFGVGAAGAAGYFKGRSDSAENIDADYLDDGDESFVDVDGVEVDSTEE
jgi:hypothetical protein